MKKLLLISFALLALLAPAATPASKPSAVPVTIAGGPEPNVIRIWLSPDGRSYVIDSSASLEVGGDVCQSPEGNVYELVCKASKISGFRINADGGDDEIWVAGNIPAPVTITGGAGNDLAVGGAGNDLLEGGADDDRLVGRAGSDVLRGWEGDDKLIGGPGNDILRGGQGEDTLIDGPGKDDAHQAALSED